MQSPFIHFVDSTKESTLFVCFGAIEYAGTKSRARPLLTKEGLSFNSASPKQDANEG